tara:strand:- start:131 stop:919 length:789 start_codon:yes stop_codon:yes gene_type:complete
MMFAFVDAWAFLKADDSDKASGAYREATIPFDKRKPVTKVSSDLRKRPFADRFGTLAISQALADMGKPIIPETPISDGKTEQVQMDEVFGRSGRHDYGSINDSPKSKHFPHFPQQVTNILNEPIMGLLGLADVKGPNVGIKDRRVQIFDPSYRTFASRFKTPIDYKQGFVDSNITNNFPHVDADELNELTQRVKDYRPAFDVWREHGDLRNWQQQMHDYLRTSNTLSFLNSIKQDPQQKKLFEYGDNPQYNQLVENLRQMSV